MLTAAFLWIYVLHLDLGLTTTTSVLTFADSIGLVRSNPVFGLGVVLMIFSLAGVRFDVRQIPHHFNGRL